MPNQYIGNMKKWKPIVKLKFQCDLYFSIEIKCVFNWRLWYEFWWRVSRKYTISPRKCTEIVEDKLQILCETRVVSSKKRLMKKCGPSFGIRLRFRFKFQINLWAEEKYGLKMCPARRRIWENAVAGSFAYCELVMLECFFSLRLNNCAANSIVHVCDLFKWLRFRNLYSKIIKNRATQTV